MTDELSQIISSGGVLAFAAVVLHLVRELRAELKAQNKILSRSLEKLVRLEERMAGIAEHVSSVFARPAGAPARRPTNHDTDPYGEET